MFIDTSKIGAKGLLLNDRIELDAKLLLEEGSYFVEPLEFTVQFNREQEKIKSRGHIKTVLSLPCVSCLDNFDFPVDSSFDVILFPIDMVDTERTALSADEMEYIFYENDEIDLEKVLLEQVNLFIPYNPVCSGHCKGICPQCGINLNYHECQCEETTQDNEMSLLFSKLKR